MSWSTKTMSKRARVVSDNDYAGDPDGLVQLAHLLLSPSVTVPFVIGSRLPERNLISSGDTAARAVVAAKHVAELCGSQVPVFSGREQGLDVDPSCSPAAEMIVAEAMRDDTDVPLFVTCGGGLREIATAWQLEPAIAERLTVVWIGGPEHPGYFEPHEGNEEVEFNTGIDLRAAQVVFNESDLKIWQVPRNVYRTAIASRAELLTRLRPAGALGRYLYEELERSYGRFDAIGLDLGEVWILGDNPMVLLTALFTGFDLAPASSPSVMIPCPRIDDSGCYGSRPDGRPLRLFTGIDQRLMTEDLYAKLALHSEESP